LCGVGDAGCVRNSLADDAGSSREVVPRIGQVHRAAEPFADTVTPLINLRHQSAGGRSQYQWVTMAAVAWHHRIVFAARGQSPHNAGFGPVAQVRVAANHAGMLDEGALDALFKLADAQHLFVHPGQPVFGKLA
jgi:hypothetical protein